MIAGRDEPTLTGTKTPLQGKEIGSTLGERMTTTKGKLKKFSATIKKKKGEHK